MVMVVGVTREPPGLHLPGGFGKGLAADGSWGLHAGSAHEKLIREQQRPSIHLIELCCLSELMCVCVCVCARV